MSVPDSLPTFEPPAASEGPPSRGFDPVSALIALVTTVALASALWIGFGPESPTEPPVVGRPAPALRLLDPTTGQPLVLLGLHGKVVWVTFWPTTGALGKSDLTDLERVWTRFRSHPKFAMAAVAVESDHAETLRKAVNETGATLPAYLAAPETVRAFGAHADNLPLHVLIDATGRVGLVTQGRDAPTLQRIADRARVWLDSLEPHGGTRFARRENTVKVATKSPNAQNVSGLWFQVSVLRAWTWSDEVFGPVGACVSGWLTQRPGSTPDQAWPGARRRHLAGVRRG